MSSELTLDEQEKIDQIKDFWKRYANLILGVLLILAIAAAGYMWWHRQALQKSAEAASLYATLQAMQQAGQASAVASLADTLMKQYPDSAYSGRGALIAAATNAAAHNDTAARTELQWVIDHSSESGMQTIARLHLAGMLLDAHQPAEALKMLDSPHDESDADLYSDLKGDALLMLGRRDQARVAYQTALQKLPADSPYRQIVEIKLNAIAGAAQP